MSSPFSLSSRYSDTMANPEMPLTLDGFRASGRFIKGIAATPEDVASFKAVFSAGPSARPLDLDIPQYAMTTFNLLPLPQTLRHSRQP